MPNESSGSSDICDIMSLAGCLYDHFLNKNPWQNVIDFIDVDPLISLDKQHEIVTELILEYLWEH